MVLFAVGLVAIVADLVLFVSGQRNLPLWLNLVCMLAPLGLGVGLVSVVKEARGASRVTARPAAPQQAGPTSPGTEQPGRQSTAAGSSVDGGDQV
jgi:hypothetical protein